MRIAYVILFCVVFSFTDIVIALIAIVQSVLAVATGQPSETFKRFGAELGLYLNQISRFVSFSSEDKPFPFSDWPSQDDQDLANDGAQDGLSARETDKERANAADSTNDEQDKG